MRQTYLAFIAALAVITACAYPDRDLDGGTPDAGPCEQPAGMYTRCADLVDGDCDGTAYSELRSLAPDESEWHLDAEDCGESEGVWVADEQFGAVVIVHRAVHVRRDGRFEDWIFVVTYRGEVCYEHYAVRYAEGGCDE